MKEGWICPRCKKINAPFISSCNCKENNSNNFNINSSVDEICWNNGYHQWEYCGVSTAGSTYRCRVCGKIKTENYNVDKSNITISSQ